MAEGSQQTDGVRFGRTILRVMTGDLSDQPVQALLYPANARGVMGAVAPGSIRLVGGAEIEREAMEGAPHDLGTAVVTGAGRLAERGVRAVIHAVVSPALGDVPRMPIVRRAVAAALQAADQARLRSLALPLIGAATDAPPAERLAVAEALIDEIVAYLRREASRLETVVLLSRFADDEVLVAEAIARVRERSWITRP